MNLWNNFTCRLLPVLSALLLPWIVIGNDPMPKDVVSGPITDLDLTLDRHPNGAVKTRMKAGGATMNGSTIDVTEMKVEISSEAGAVETVIEADQCHFDKASNLAESAGAISVEHPDLKVTGTGFRWSVTDQRMEVLSKVRVELRRGMGVNLLGGHAEEASE